jgi:hypothetical protein
VRDSWQLLYNQNKDVGGGGTTQQEYKEIKIGVITGISKKKNKPNGKQMLQF